MEMKTIYSTENKIYKLCKELTTKKYRDRLGKYIAEGVNLIEEAVKSGAEVEYFIVREDYEGKALILAEQAACTIFMSRQLFAGLAQTETSQGILAVVSKKTLSPEAFYERVGDGNIVVLDRLQDHGNIGTVIRTAEAAGYRGVVALKGTGDIYSPKTVRAAAGSVFRMPVLQEETASIAAGRVKQYGKRLLATCADGSYPYYEIDMKKNTALVIGNEGNGISRELMALTELRVSIPMQGQVESLNAAIAAAILMYESSRP